MASKTKHGTKIEWTHGEGYKGETWNPWVGCSRVSKGCEHCYSERMSKRLAAIGVEHYRGLLNEKGVFNGNINRASDKQFYKPLRWRDPRMIFTCSMSDFFHKGADEWRDEVWDIIRRTPRHIYQILTKRPQRIKWSYPLGLCVEPQFWKHVWLGVSVENKKERRRIDTLRTSFFRVRFLSLEPLLEDLGTLNLNGIHQCIVGGESGPGARPMHPDWARSIRDQCQAAGVPFFFKQWGEWTPGQFTGKHAVKLVIDGSRLPGIFMSRVGKKRAGRALDGREWNEMPLTITGD